MRARDGDPDQRRERGFILRRFDGRRVAVIALARSAGGRSLRGYSLISVLVDESEFTAPSSDGAVVTDTDLIAAVMPRLMSGGQLVLASTPWPAESATGFNPIALPVLLIKEAPHLAAAAWMLQLA